MQLDEQGGCKGYAKPFKMFAPHTDGIGLAIIGKRLYMSEFGPQPGRFDASSGGAIKPLITGFAAPIVGLAANGRYIYVGELTGQLFRVKVWSVRGGMTNVAAPTPPICIGLLLAGCSEPIGGVYET